MEGVYKVKDFESQIDDIIKNGYDRGPEIGFYSLDQHYRPKLGMFTVIRRPPTAILDCPVLYLWIPGIIPV